MLNIRSLERFALLAVDNPRLFDALDAASGIQPRLDPQAGYGRMQAQVLVNLLELTDKDLEALDVDSDYNPAKFYLALRAASLRYWPKDGLRDLLRAGEPLDYVGALEHVCSICEDFNAEMLTPHL